MLTINLDKRDFYDDDRERFITFPAMVVDLEHSLASVSKWESIHKKPFLSGAEKTTEETFSYIRCMLLTPEVSDTFAEFLPNEEILRINEYVKNPSTATWFGETPGPKKSQEIITAEIIYYWMVSFTIPFECQYWHLDRLLTLIRVCEQKSNPGKKRSPAELAAHNRALNEQRRAQYNTAG